MSQEWPQIDNFTIQYYIGTCLMSIYKQYKYQESRYAYGTAEKMMYILNGNYFY